jgi:hypothetical protein
LAADGRPRFVIRERTQGRTSGPRKHGNWKHCAFALIWRGWTIAYTPAQIELSVAVSGETIASVRALAMFDL